MDKQKLEGNDKIIDLANKLIKAINKEGYSIMNPTIASDFGAFDINVYGHGTNNVTVQVQKICANGGNTFNITGKAAKGIK